MLQLQVTDERGAVTQHAADIFPFLIGRSPNAQLRLVASGVWEEHASISLIDQPGRPAPRFIIEPVRESLLTVNGEAVRSKEISMGDEISLGAARILVSLAPGRQTRLGWHETAVWAILIFVVIVEAMIVQLAD